MLQGWVDMLDEWTGKKEVGVMGLSYRDVTI